MDLIVNGKSFFKDILTYIENMYECACVLLIKGLETK